MISKTAKMVPVTTVFHISCLIPFLVIPHAMYDI